MLLRTEILCSPITMLSCLSQLSPWCLNSVSLAKLDFCQQNSFGALCSSASNRTGTGSRNLLLDLDFSKSVWAEGHMYAFSSNRYCFPWKISHAISDFLSHKRIVLGVKVLVPGCQGGSPAVITFLTMWLRIGKVFIGSNSFSTSFALSCHAFWEWLFLFNVLLFLRVFWFDLICFFLAYCWFLFLHLFAVKDAD